MNESALWNGWWKSTQVAKSVSFLLILAPHNYREGEMGRQGGSRPRQRGVQGERELIRLLRSIGLEYSRNLEQFRSSSDEDLIPHDPGYPSIQVKTWRSWHRAFLQAMVSPIPSIWAIKIPRRGWLFVGPYRGLRKLFGQRINETSISFLLELGSNSGQRGGQQETAGLPSFLKKGEP